ncbi:MAG TPA: rRNA maturation RNase YbeY [Clostridiales bacterium]|nr:rRNA maturation RNase YbeY [Clostridiales bacterium]HPV01562.1 rRNA maturation RNase YbeY [Clostridiales bacterium]
METKRLKSIEETLVFIENEQSHIDITEEHENLLRKTALACLEQESIGVACEVNILLTDDEAIRQINAEFRNKDVPTDVLSFPMADITKGRINDFGNDSDPDEGLLVIGDIVISVETARRQSEQYGHSFERELAFLAAHGMYHLMGYDHEDELDEKEMMEKQEAVLKELGLRRA